MANSGSESESESPEVISSTKMKSEREREIMEMFQQKRKIHEAQKLKRKLKAEKFAQQKKEKLMRQKLLLEQGADDDIEDDEEIDDSPKPSVDEAKEGETDLKLTDKPLKGSMTKKFYPKYNIEVDPLTKISNPRAISALNFKERRMASVHREKVAPTLSAYHEKMLVKNK